MEHYLFERIRLTNSENFQIVVLLEAVVQNDAERVRFLWQMVPKLIWMFTVRELYEWLLVCLT